jgi:hypothetical protein
MTVICSRPTTKESRKRHAETFGEDPFSRSRWLEYARPDETYAEWVARAKLEDRFTDAANKAHEAGKRARLLVPGVPPTLRAWVGKDP